MALHHPAVQCLLQYATQGWPVQTGKPWTVEQLQAAIERCPHMSALERDTIDQLQEEAKEKVQNGQAWIVEWDDIKDNPPREL